MPPRHTRGTLLAGASALALLALPSGAFASASASASGPVFGNLFVTTSTYAGNAGTVAVGQALPNTNGAAAVADGSYPGVFANDVPDPNFGITAPIQLLSFQSFSSPLTGVLVGPAIKSVDVTGLTGVVTSYSSKSELAINPSTDGNALTFVGYTAPVNAIDVSNSNTAGHVDPTNSDTVAPYARTVVQVDLGGGLAATPTGAYSGNNGRAAVLIRGATPSQDQYVLVGNAGNGSGIEPRAVATDTGVEVIAPGSTTANNVEVGVQNGTYGQKNGFQLGFAVQNLGYPADKSGKDDNFRGLTVFDGNVYVTKGSGGNGVDTVYQVNVPGGAANLTANAASATITPLPGLPTTLASSSAANFFPFGIFFANKTTLYVADEGAQSLTPTPNAGLEKWVYDGTKWNLAYVLQNGLNLGIPYAVSNYPALYQPSNTGLRNITGEVNGDTVTIFGVTATYSQLGDPGADPNAIVQITDRISATQPAANERFHTTFGPIAGLLYRGVAYLDCNGFSQCLRNTVITK